MACLAVLCVTNRAFMTLHHLRQLAPKPAPVAPQPALTPKGAATAAGGSGSGTAATEPTGPAFAPTDCTVFKLENGAMFQQIVDL